MVIIIIKKLHFPAFFLFQLHTMIKYFVVVFVLTFMDRAADIYS